MFEKLKIRVDRFLETVYYEPMSEGEIVELEKRIGKSLNTVYREFLLTFGLVQDINDSINSSVEEILEDVDYLREKLPDYFPIFVDVDEEDTIYLMSTLNPESEKIFKVVDDDGKLGKIQYHTTLTDLLFNSIQEIERNESERCPNSEKINCFEYSFEREFYTDFIEIFTAAGLKQLSDWQPKYYPNNVFGDEIAKFVFYGMNFQMERNEDETEYRFEFDESILIKKEESIAKKFDELFEVQRIKYKKEVVKLIST